MHGAASASVPPNGAATALEFGVLPRSPPALPSPPELLVGRLRFCLLPGLAGPLLAVGGGASRATTAPTAAAPPSPPALPPADNALPLLDRLLLPDPNVESYRALAAQMS
jgi:hypothetical protein